MCVIFVLILDQRTRRRVAIYNQNGGWVGSGKYIGVDAVYSGINAMDTNTENSMPSGYQVSFGLGYGIDYHFKTTQTETIKILN